MSFVALLWLLIERGGSPTDVGWLAAIHTAPVIIGGIATGPILDAFDPRRVLAADNALRGLAMASVPIAAAMGALTTAHLFVVAAIYGLLFMTSAAGIPSLITARSSAESDLITANAMESLSFSLVGARSGRAGRPADRVRRRAVRARDRRADVLRLRRLPARHACGGQVRRRRPRARRRRRRDGAATAPTSARASARPSGSSSAPRRSSRSPLFYMSVNIAGGIVDRRDPALRARRPAAAVPRRSAQRGNERTSRRAR